MNHIKTKNSNSATNSLGLHQKHKLHYSNDSQHASIMGSPQIHFQLNRPSSWVAEILHKSNWLFRGPRHQPRPRRWNKKWWETNYDNVWGIGQTGTTNSNWQQYNYSRRSTHTIQSTKSHTNHHKRWRTLLELQSWSYEWSLRATTRTNTHTKHRNHNANQKLQIPVQPNYRNS